jgi:subtilisin family serine protease
MASSLFLLSLRFTGLICFVCLLGGLPTERLCAEQIRSRPDRLLVRPHPAARPEALAALHARNGCQVIRRFPACGDLQVLSLPAYPSASTLLAQYRNSGLVEYAEPDYLIKLDGILSNDPQVQNGTLWGLNNAGQEDGVANADIDAIESWATLTSASNVIVAVVDSGISYTHEDLTNNLWTAAHDGSHGFNGLTGSTNAVDDNGHGTRVAGVIGATGNNGLGVAGVAWKVQLMACKFVNQAGVGGVSDAIACLEFARSNGAHIVNASWGLNEFSASLSNAFAALQAAGVVVVAAAGNEARNIDVAPHYPASFTFDNILVAAATTRRDELYPLSNLGPANVDLAAPGEAIYSTDHASPQAYIFDHGTSMAAAYVSGAAALLRAAFPADSPAQLGVRLLNSADPLPVLSGMSVSGGRLNLRKALGISLWPPLLQASLASPQGIALSLTANPGRSYLVETSSNLTAWWVVSTNLTSLEGSLSFSNEINWPRQFYRARLAP